jgi:hypothetical protein
MTLIIIGIVTALNFMFIYMKIQQERYEDAALDVILFVVIVFLFAGTLGGMTVGMIASCIMSIFLYVNPPKLNF